MPWPSIPSGRENDVVEYNKILYKGQVDEELARRQDAATAASKEAERDAERQKAAWDAEYALRKTVHDTRLEVAKAAIERGRAGAEFVRNAAAAIVTLYTGILGVAFATSAGAERLPARGVAPAVFSRPCGGIIDCLCCFPDEGPEHSSASAPFLVIR
jgi:hypothetical protein